MNFSNSYNARVFAQIKTLEYARRHNNGEPLVEAARLAQVAASGPHMRAANAVMRAVYLGTDSELREAIRVLKAATL
jgi:hypothetical protein